MGNIADHGRFLCAKRPGKPVCTRLWIKIYIVVYVYFMSNSCFCLRRDFLPEQTSTTEKREY
jgi:hypothetical protein